MKNVPPLKGSFNHGFSKVGGNVQRPVRDALKIARHKVPGLEFLHFGSRLNQVLCAVDTAAKRLRLKAQGWMLLLHPTLGTEGMMNQPYRGCVHTQPFQG